MPTSGFEPMSPRGFTMRGNKLDTLNPVVVGHFRRMLADGKTPEEIGAWLHIKRRYMIDRYAKAARRKA